MVSLSNTAAARGGWLIGCFTDLNAYFASVEQQGASCFEEFRSGGAYARLGSEGYLNLLLGPYLEMNRIVRGKQLTWAQWVGKVPLCHLYESKSLH